MLVVDDEPDNLDLLYRTFRRDFRVFKADSGANALEVLSAEGEVAVIISDQRMPEMKGTEFLSQTVPQFPDTIRIILTGFTDVEDLVEAINSGQVYKYITKPWDPNELKGVVDRAAETYEVLKQRTEELEKAQQQTTLMAEILQASQKCEALEEGATQLATAIGESFVTDACIVQLVEGQTLAPIAGYYGRPQSSQMSLEEDALVKEAIASQTPQLWKSSPATPPPESYQKAGVQVHLIVPAIYRQELLALLSLQWNQPKPLPEATLQAIGLFAQLAALALAKMRSQ